MIISIILAWLMINTGSVPGPGIDFNPRLLQKEVSAIFGDMDLNWKEIMTGSEINTGEVNGKFFEVKCNNGGKISVYIGRVNSCRTGGCSNPGYSLTDLQYEYFDYFIIFDADKKVKTVRVFNYEATHGHEIMIKKWLSQFSGYDGNRHLRVGKEIDSISGATMSVYAIVADVKEKTVLLNSYR